MRASSVTLTREQALGRASEQLKSYQESLPEESRILSVQTKIMVKNGKLMVSYTIRCEENIAKESEMLIKS